MGTHKFDALSKAQISWQRAYDRWKKLQNAERIALEKARDAAIFRNDLRRAGEVE